MMILMHKNTPVAEINFANKKPISYGRIYNESLLPIGTKGNGFEQEQILLNHWYKGRTVPNLRPNLANLEEKLGTSISDATIKSAGLSLTDRYWFKRENDMLIWEDINYHDNGFSPIFANYYADNKLSFAPSPDYTTDGVMEKFWLPIAGQPHLFKFDKEYNNLLSANEIVYFKIANELGIKTTPYFAGKSEVGDYCCCPCFVNNIECDYINAMQIKHTPQITNTGIFYFNKTGEKLAEYFSKDLGFEKEIKEMATLDCLLHNTDRHERNYGFLQYDDGTKIFVPLFDNGFCLGIGLQLNQEITDCDIKPFRKPRKEILQKYGLNMDIQNIALLDILEETYQEFEIEEKLFDTAKRELLCGINLVKENSSKIFTGYKEKEI